MQVTHEFDMRSVCPVNGATDWYHVTIHLDRLVMVEEIIECASAFGEKRLFQEEITQRLAIQFKARVITYGNHSKVRTRCECSFL